MRKVLASARGVRKKFQAVFSRFGKKTNYHGYADKTVLLVRITDLETNKLATDHLWFNFTKGFEKINLQPGTTIQFEARIKTYKKGYVNKSYKLDQRRIDFKLSHPTAIRIISDVNQ